MAVNSGKRQDDYFDERETMSRDAREHFFSEQLARVVENTYRKSAVMKKRLDDAGVTPEMIQTVGDIEKLPILKKTDLIDMQKANPPFGGIVTIPRDEIERIFISPGPVYEIQPSNVQFFARSFRAAGFGKGDIVINTFTYHMSPAGMLFHEGIRACGATVVVAGTGNTDMQVQIMKDLGVNGFVGTPSFLMAVINRAAELGLDPRKDLAVTKAWFTGEMLSPSLRTIFEGEYGINTCQAYAVTEPGGCIAYECREKSGMHFMDDYIIEVIDPETGKQRCPGEVGEVVVTPIYSLDCGLLRFGTGDLSAFTDEPCACGRTSRRLTGIVGRTGDAVKVRGMFVVAKQAEQVITGTGHISRYQMLVDRINQRDELILRVEAKETDSDTTSVSEDIGRRFHAICRVTIDRVEFVDKGVIPEDEQGLIDRRKWV
jgi:phenylacetate-CoA ligase